MFFDDPKVDKNTVAGWSLNRNQENNFACSFTAEAVGEQSKCFYSEV